MIEQPPTPMRFVFSFSSKSQWGQAAANHRARVTGVES